MTDHGAPSGALLFLLHPPPSVSLFSRDKSPSLKPTPTPPGGLRREHNASKTGKHFPCMDNFIALSYWQGVSTIYLDALMPTCN
jgi:hypothetical protein